MPGDPMLQPVLPSASRPPTQTLTVTFGRDSRDRLVDQIETFATEFGFAIWLDRDVATAGGVFVKMYREDMKLVGTLNAGGRTLDMDIFKTPGDPVPMWAVSRVAAGLAGAAKALPGAAVAMSPPVPDTTPKTYEPQAPLHSALITVPEGSRRGLMRAFKTFAAQYGFALRLARSTPEPDDLTVSLYRDDVKLIGETAFTPRELKIAIYETYRRPVAPAVVDRVLADLARAVDQVPGVTFVEKPRR